MHRCGSAQEADADRDDPQRDEELGDPREATSSSGATTKPATTDLRRATVAEWQHRLTPTPTGPWLFSRRVEHDTRLRTSCAGQWFTELADRAGHRDVTLHRLQHTAATVLVGHGDILQAHHRLGHRDASTTLRIYSHALPLSPAGRGGPPARPWPTAVAAHTVRR